MQRKINTFKQTCQQQNIHHHTITKKIKISSWLYPLIGLSVWNIQYQATANPLSTSIEAIKTQSENRNDIIDVFKKSQLQNQTVNIEKNSTDKKKKTYINRNLNSNIEGETTNKDETSPQETFPIANNIISSNIFINSVSVPEFSDDVANVNYLFAEDNLEYITENNDSIPQRIPHHIAQNLPNPNEPNNPANFPELEPSETLDPQQVEEELGEIKPIQPRPVQQPAPRPQPTVQLLLRSSIFSSSNITAVDFLPRSDTVFINSATLLTTPKLGDQTRLVASATGGLARFATKEEFDYNFASFNVGVQQRISKGMYGQLGWVQDRLYDNGDGERILLDDSIRLTIGRQDQLASRLRLDSFYDLRASFATPEKQSRIANALGARLRYDLSPRLQAGLDYRLTFKDYTQQSRFDTQHQIGLDLVYNINQDLFIGSSASYLFGSSSASSIDLNNFSVGINVGLNVPF